MYANAGICLYVADFQLRGPYFYIPSINIVESLGATLSPLAIDVHRNEG